MESPVNSEDTVTTTKEPIKNEERPSSNSEERSDGASSPPPNCSICLGKLVNTSFTDSCLHQFCFTCLLQWSRIKTECPLCKQTFKSIIHNVRSEVDYDQYHVPRESAQASGPTTAIAVSVALTRASMAAAVRRFAYRTTMLPNRRFGLLSTSVQHQRPEPASNNSSTSSSVTREERRYRHNIYRTGEWSDPIPDLYGRFRECSAEFYRRYPHEIDRLIPWINRDLQTLFHTTNATPHLAYVLRIIVDSLTRYDMRSPEFRDLLLPYFGIHTDHFIHELMNYARTDSTLNEYDDLLTFLHHPNHGVMGAYWNRIQSQSSSSNSSSSTSDDSDVRVVDRIDVETPSVGPHLLSMPGPSTVSQTFQLNPIVNRPCVLTISSSSSESDCEIIGYVKPRHERTPEIIELASSDEESSIINNTVPVVDTPRSPTPNPLVNHPSTSCECERRNQNTSSSSDIDTDSDYSQTKKRSSRRKKRSSKSNHASTSKVSPKKSGGSRKRNKYSYRNSSSDSNKELKKRRTLRRTKSTNHVFSSSSDDDDDDDNLEMRNTERIKAVDNTKISNVRVRKDLMNDSRKNSLTHSSSDSSTSDSSDITSSSLSSISTITSSSSSTNTRYKKLRRKFLSRKLKDNNSSNQNADGNSANYFNTNPSSSHYHQHHHHHHDRLQFDGNNTRSSRSRLKSTVIKINSTVLRKDTNKKEWYVDKNKSLHSRSRSRSSYDSDSDDSSRCRSALNEYREKRVAKKLANEKIKNERLYYMSDSENDEESQRSNSQCSGYSDSLKTKYKSNNKNSTSTMEITSKAHKNKSRKKSSKDGKDKQKKSRGKYKRDKRHKDYSSSSSC